MYLRLHEIIEYSDKIKRTFSETSNIISNETGIRPNQINIETNTLKNKDVIIINKNTGVKYDDILTIMYDVNPLLKNKCKTVNNKEVGGILETKILNYLNDGLTPLRKTRLSTHITDVTNVSQQLAQITEEVSESVSRFTI